MGITVDELKRAKEDLDFEDGLEDFNLEKNKIVYEIWAVGYSENYEATDFEVLLDDGYTERVEAKKCYDYFATDGTLKAYLENKGITIPEEVKHIHLVLEEYIDLGEDGTEAQDWVEDTEIL